jgi:hypothetical protein
LPWSHHRLSSCLSTGLNQWTFTVSTSAFFNKIGQKRRFAAAQRYVSNWEYSRPASCLFETMQLICSVPYCSPNKTPTALWRGDARHHALT